MSVKSRGKNIETLIFKSSKGIRISCINNRHTLAKDPHQCRGNVIETERHCGVMWKCFNKTVTICRIIQNHQVSGSKKIIVSFSLHKKTGFQLSVVLCNRSNS